jgi:hypothetical protein
MDLSTADKAKRVANRTTGAISDGASKVADKIGDLIGCKLKFTDASKKECELAAKYKGKTCSEEATQALKDECTKAQSGAASLVAGAVTLVAVASMM